MHAVIGSIFVVRWPSHTFSLGSGLHRFESFSAYPLQHVNFSHFWFPRHLFDSFRALGETGREPVQT
jgi:hypothetical protein